jgi:hypothetical protein
MKALISNNEVIDIQPQEFEVHPSLIWIDCDDTVSLGDKLVDGRFIKPEILPISYDYARRLAYPPVTEQLDYLYHNGFDAWKAMIADIKNQYPKEIE